jgi:hypothetical protein
MENMPKSIAQKLLAIRKKVETIKKSKYNKFRKYPYSSEADVYAALKPLLNEHNLLVYPEVIDSRDLMIMETEFNEKTNTSEEKQSILTDVKLRIVWIDCDTGDSCAVQYGAKGIDRGDKGLSKAVTFGFRSYLLKILLYAEDGEEDPQLNNFSNDQKNNYNSNYNKNKPNYSQQKPALTAVPPATPAATTTDTKKYECSNCHTSITQATSAYSLNKYKTQLCQKCQNLRTAVTPPAVGQ